MALSDAQKRAMKRLNTRPMKGTTRYRVTRTYADGAVELTHKVDGNPRKCKLTRSGAVRR